jgi:glucosyl-dolichyl phosphate glucuronosyltransferase
MRITVGIATWNRGDSLARTLRSLERVLVPESVRWEVLVVDNNSTDHTAAVISRFAERLPLVGLFEPIQGKSSALNTLVAAASGDYVLWTDDDVLFDSNWIRAYCDGFARHPDVGIWGGSIAPMFLGRPPAWISRSMSEIGGVYGLCEPCEGAFTTTDSPLPFGANMAIRMDVQRRYLFDPTLGRNAGVMLAGEEAAMVRAALSDGVAGRWLPGAKVRHVVPPNLQTRLHVRRYFRGLGATMAIDPREGSTGRRVRIEPWVLRQAVESEVRYRVGRAFRGHQSDWVRHLRLASTAQGFVRAVWGASWRGAFDRGQRLR